MSCSFIWVGTGFLLLYKIWTNCCIYKRREESEGQNKSKWVISWPVMNNDVDSSLIRPENTFVFFLININTCSIFQPFFSDQPMNSLIKKVFIRWIDNELSALRSVHVPSVCVIKEFLVKWEFFLVWGFMFCVHVLICNTPFSSGL